MEAKIKKELGTSTLKATGYSGSGCISEGHSYSTDNGTVFVKINHKSQAKEMFDGEMASLEAIIKTETIKVPKPVKVIELDTGGSVFVMEHVDMKGLTKYSKVLGERMANLHLHNKRQLDKLIEEQQTIVYVSLRMRKFHQEVSGITGLDLSGHEDVGSQIGKGAGQSEVATIEKYGFHVPTCCGSIPQENEWQDDWVTFYSRNRLEHQLNLVEKSYGDREARELWTLLQPKIPQMFADVEVVPALLHGDLWGGNVAECSEGPVIFDPASFYGHSEYELAIAGMFGGFNSSFYSAYHDKIPNVEGYEQRNQLYQLFHYLNHWNHFGGGYRGSSIRIMKDLVK